MTIIPNTSPADVLKQNITAGKEVLQNHRQDLKRLCEKAFQCKENITWAQNYIQENQTKLNIMKQKEGTK